MRTAQPIESTSSHDPRWLRGRYLDLRKPVVFRGLASGWEATRTWSPRSLVERYAALEITLERCRPSTKLTDPLSYLHGRYYERVRLQDAVREIVSGQAPPGTYITYADVFSPATDLGQDVQLIHRELGTSPWLPTRLRDSLCSRPGFWLGPAGAVTVTHFDRLENFNAQIAGRKRWTLFAPKDGSSLYANRGGTPTPIFSPCDIDEPDYARFPHLRDAQPLVAELDPGDVIYVPSGFWHHVRSLDLAISVNFWWWTLACLRTLAAIGIGQVPVSAQRWLHGQTGVQSMPLD